MKARILVVDDEKDMLLLLRRILDEETEHEVVTESDSVKALDRFRNEPFDLVITDLRMPECDGLEILDAVKRMQPDTAVILLTAYATIDSAMEAVRKGAFDYLTKPFRRDRILLTVEQALALRAVVSENVELKLALSEREGGVRFLGGSPVIQSLLKRARQVAETTATVLITGASGTGKEVLACYIHEHSRRRKRKMITVGCTAIPETMLESELFGHVRGAFTGAVRDKRGLVEEAHGGTLFLDEIGDLSAVLQTKLLRLLQGGEYKSVGSVKTRMADIRILAATNRDLDEAIADGTFREDLYYRLNVIRLELPALAGRRSDIPTLAQHFLKKFSRRHGKPVREISPSAIQALLNRDFPGNVRELENTVERGVVYCRGTVLDVADLDLDGAGSWFVLPERDGSPLPFREAKEEMLLNFNRQYLADLLGRTGGNISEAARLAGIQRQYLHRLLKEAGISGAEYRGGSPSG